MRYLYSLPLLFLMTTATAEITDLVPVDYNVNFNGDGAAIWRTTTGYKCLAWDSYEIYHETRTRLKSASKEQVLSELNAYTNPLRPDQEPVCQALYDANPFPIWVVKQNRSYPDRPVKRIVNDTVGAETIGRIVVGWQCGKEVESNTKTIWRVVRITYPDNSIVTGASVCVEQP